MEVPKLYSGNNIGFKDDYYVPRENQRDNVTKGEVKWCDKTSVEIVCKITYILCGLGIVKSCRIFLEILNSEQRKRSEEGVVDQETETLKSFWFTSNKVCLC